jgi:hypothetical protein
VLEKNVDFAELDASMVLGAVEHLFKIDIKEEKEFKQTGGDSSSDKRF